MNASKELERLFDAERLERASMDVRGESWERLRGALAANAPAMTVGAGPLKIGLSLLGKGFIATSVTVLAVGGATWSLAPHEPREARPSTVATVEAAREAPEKFPAPRVIASEPPPAFAAPPGSSSAPIAKPSAESTFDEELRLIQLAKGELDAGRARKAESWLTEHESRYPNGVFAAERRALFVLTGCAGLGDPTIKQARGAEFARRNPGSPFLDRVLRACGSPAAMSDGSPARAEQAPSRASFEIDEGGK